MGSSGGMPQPTSMGARPMGGMSGVAGPSPVIYSGPPASSGYGGRGGMPDGRGGIADGRGGMPDGRGGMPDGRGGISDMLIAQMSSARSFDTIIIRNLPLDLNGEVLREGFSHCGDIQNAAMTEGGSGLIRFRNKRDAERAVSMMHKQTVAGRVIDVRPY